MVGILINTEMKRKIKFRAWHQARKEMRMNAESAYDSDVDCFGDFIENDQYIVMQFTGITDITGREVYEGDVINIGVLRSGYGRHEQVMIGERLEVVFVDAWSAFGGTDGGAFFYFCDMRDIVVIGNIYENPDIL